MNTSGRGTALARLQSQRKKIKQELTQVERQMAQTKGQILSLHDRITRLTDSQRRAA